MARGVQPSPALMVSSNTPISECVRKMRDLDGVPPKTWATFLKALNQFEKHPPVVVFFDPRLHDESHNELLRKLSLPGSLEVFAKPLNVIGFLARVRELAATSS